MIWTGVLVILAVLVALLLSSNVKFQLKVVREQSDDQIVLDIQGIYGVIKRRFTIPVVRFKGFVEGVDLKGEFINPKKEEVLASKEEKITKGSIKETFDHVMELLRNCFKLHEWIADTMAHVHCTRFFWTTRMGLGDAAETAMAVGMVWGLKTSMMGFLFRFIKLDVRPEINVLPQYNKTEFSTEVLVMSRIRMFYAAGAGIQLLYRILKVKGGLKTWQRVLFKG